PTTSVQRMPEPQIGNESVGAVFTNRSPILYRNIGFHTFRRAFNSPSVTKIHAQQKLARLVDRSHTATFGSQGDSRNQFVIGKNAASQTQSGIKPPWGRFIGCDQGLWMIFIKEHAKSKREKR